MSHPSPLSHFRSRAIATAMLSAMVLVAAALPTGAAGPPGNNGTVKIHSSGEGEPSPELMNEAHVTCPFHVSFFFADTQQAGDWEIIGQAPTADADSTAGSYNTGDDTTFVTGDLFLNAGHYTLSWQGRSENNVKHKTFWVEGACGGGGGAPGG